MIALAEEPFGQGRYEQRLDRHGAGGLPGDCHFGRIAAKRLDVVAHPLQGRDLILYPVITRAATLFFRQIGMRHESEAADAVVEIDDDDPFLRQVDAVVDRHRT